MILKMVEQIIKITNNRFLKFKEGIKGKSGFPDEWELYELFDDEKHYRRTQALCGKLEDIGKDIPRLKMLIRELQFNLDLLEEENDK